MEGHKFPTQYHKTSMRMSTAAVIPGCSLLPHIPYSYTEMCTSFFSMFSCTIAVFYKRSIELNLPLGIYHTSMISTTLPGPAKFVLQQWTLVLVFDKDARCLRGNDWEKHPTKMNHNLVLVYIA